MDATDMSEGLSARESRPCHAMKDYALGSCHSFLFFPRYCSETADT